MLDLQFIKNALGLQEKDHIVSEENGKILKFVVFSDVTEQICPECGLKTTRIHDYRTQNVKTVNIVNKQTILVLKKRRYVCPHCGKRFYEHYNFIAKHHHIAKNVFTRIIDDLKELRSMKSIAKANNVSATTVQRALNLAGYTSDFRLPEVLSIDEFKGNAGGEKYLLQVSDAKNKKLLNILPCRKKLYISQYFAAFSLEERKKVKYLVIDMWRDYADIKIYFPNAKLVIDKYHYKRQIHWAIDRIRKRIQKTFSKDCRLRFKRLRFLLHKKYEELKTEDRIALRTILEQSEELYTAWHLKETFNEIMKISDYDEGVRCFKQWIELVESMKIPEFNDCTKAFRRWFWGITESFRVPYSNGFTEGKNNKIKVLKRNAFGFRNFDNYRKRILLAA